MVDYFYHLALKECREKLDPSEFGKAIQALVALLLRKSGHRVIERGYSYTGVPDIETEFEEGRRFVFEVTAEKPREEVDITDIGKRIREKIGEKRWIFLDSSFPAKFIVFNLNLTLPSKIMLSSQKRYEDKELTKKLNEVFPSFLKEYRRKWEEVDKDPDLLRKFIESDLGVSR